MGQAEGVVEFARRVGESRKVVEFVRSEEFSGALFCAEMDESECGALRLDLWTKFG